MSKNDCDDATSESASDSGSGSENESKSSSSSRSGSESGSGSESESGSGSSNSGSECASGSTSTGNKSSPEKTQRYDTSQSRKSPDLKQVKKSTSSDLEYWEQNPDIYGIRRSGRSRKEPERLNVAESDSSDKGKKKIRKGSAYYTDSSDSESESGSQRKRRLPAVRKDRPVAKHKDKRKLRKSKYSESSDESSFESDVESRRPSSRRAAAKVSYKEAESDAGTASEEYIEVETESQALPAESDGAEVIEKIMEHRTGKKGATGANTTLYAIEEHGDPNETIDNSETEMQFLIKWKGWSHIHNTWESEKTLQDQKVKGLKKLDNYLRREDDIKFWKQNASPEDIEYSECQNELQQELYKSYMQAERIISYQHGANSEPEYCVKWENLPYSEATFEDEGLVNRKWPEKIKEFHERSETNNKPQWHCRVLKHRPKFQSLKYQPSYLGNDVLVLRDYQLYGLNWLINSWCKQNSVILADEMGLGKTIQTISFLYTLYNQHMLYGPFLLVVPLSTMASWQREFAQWAPKMNVVTYLGDIVSRERIRSTEWTVEGSKQLKFNALLTTYEILLKDKPLLGAIKWSVLAVDEAHRLKNDDSLLYKSLMEFETNHRLLITGTPLQNSLKELWALLHFIMPQKFETWEDFEEEHDNAAQKGYAKLHKQLEPFILRRVKKDVEKSLPAKVEQILRVEMSAVQKQYYKWILTKNYTALRKGNKGSASSFINIVMELKKCCNHAFLVKPPDVDPSDSTERLQQILNGSGKLKLLNKLLERLREKGHRVLIFSQMVRMLDLIAEYLALRHYPFQRLDGSIKGEMRRQALDHFNAEGSVDFCFLLSTRAGGLGINLATADTVIIFDSDWNPQNDLQAQARAHRIGQKNQVNIYRLVNKNSVEEDIVERAKRKMVLDHLVIQRMDTTGRMVLDKKSSNNTTPFSKDELSAILKFGAEELFKDEEDGTEEQCDIDDILRRAETRDEAPSTVGDELLSAFKVASFSAFDDDDVETPLDTNQEEETKDWDDIIPEDFRKKIEDEEKQKEMEDLYLPPRSRKTVQQAAGQHDDEQSSGRSKKRKQRDASESTNEGSEDERPKKRGRPRMNPRDNIKGFTDAEIRRFVRSYKKFAVPLSRLETIAVDAELQEKPMSDLQRLADTLRQRCKEAMLESQSQKENENGPTDDINAGAVKKRDRGPSFKLAGVSVNAKTVLACEEELAPLEKCIPSECDEQLKWRLDIKAKDAHFDVEWGLEEDSRLLCGIYKYGMGSWEQIRTNTALGLTERIRFEDDRKPQAKHLQTRAEYLLKLMAKKINLTKPPKQRKPRKAREIKAISKPFIENDVSSGDENVSAASIIKKQNKKLKQKNSEENVPGPSSTGGEVKNELDVKKKKLGKTHVLEKKKSKKDMGPMHFQAFKKPQALSLMGDLDAKTFEECKEKMRPVKKALKALDNPDFSVPEVEQMMRTKQCLMEIGNQIKLCLEPYTDPSECKEWERHLWYFVSRFTSYEHKKLSKLYKQYVKRAKRKADKGSSSDRKSNKEQTSENKDSSSKKKEHKTSKSENNHKVPQKRPNNGESENVVLVKKPKQEKEERSKERREAPPGPFQNQTFHRHDFDRRHEYPNNVHNRHTPQDHEGDRWNREKDRYPGSNEYKRDRMENYQRMHGGPSQYRGGRDHGRERDHRIHEKRRYHGGPSSGYNNMYAGAPQQNYMHNAQGFHSSDSVHSFPRERVAPMHPPPPHMQYADWRPKDRDYSRRDYDRRPHPS